MSIKKRGHICPEDTLRTILCVKSGHFFEVALTSTFKFESKGEIDQLISFTDDFQLGGAVDFFFDPHLLLRLRLGIIIPSSFKNRDVEFRNNRKLIGSDYCIFHETSYLWEKHVDWQ